MSNFDKADPDGSTSPLTKPGKTVISINGNDRSKDLKEHDVVCEKGRGDHERWPGNKLYRHLINVHKETYNDLAPIERSNVIGKIISTIQEKDGWFVHNSETSGTWARLTEEKVRKKVSDDLRREVRRRREKRSHNSLFSAKLRAIKEMEDQDTTARDILEQVDDPRQTDVLFGPGARRHPGNKTYWHLMKINLDQYIISPYGARSVISRNIVQGVRTQHGRFLEQDHQTGLWYSISDKRAIEKTSHALSNMKYKTRKRHPDEPDDVYQHPGPIAYRVGPFEGFGYAEESEEDKILDTDSPNTVFAKKARSKKFRLLNRMGDEDEEVKAVKPGNTEGGAQPTTSPVPGMESTEGKVISPNESTESGEDYQEYQEQRNPNSLARVLQNSSAGMPTEADYLAYRSNHATGTDISPRISAQYQNYLKSYAGGAAYKSLNYTVGGAMSNGYRYEYGAQPQQQAHGAPAASTPTQGQMAMLQSGNNPYGGFDEARRLVLKSAAGASPYWASGAGGASEWPPEYYQGM
ncbi:MAG: hypothetical protein SGILL_004256 [Bacillariaceae sp.]